MYLYGTAIPEPEACSLNTQAQFSVGVLGEEAVDHRRNRPGFYRCDVNKREGESRESQGPDDRG